MNEPNRRFFSGDTLHQALVQAANYHNLQPELIAYRLVDKRHGFLKNPRKVVIEVDPDAPRRESPLAPPPSERVLPPPPPSSFLRREPRTEMPSGPLRELPPREPQPLGEPRPPREPRGDRGPRAPGGDRGPRREGNRSRGGDRRGGNRPGGDRPRRPRGDRPDRPRSFEPRGDRPPRFEAPSGEPGLVELPAIPRSKSDRYPLAEGPVAEAAEKSIGILLRIAGLDLAPRVFQGEERLEIDLSGEDVDWCFADDGEFLMALEHLLPRMIRSLCGEAVLVRVDCDNFHEIREERLRSLAQRVADEVRRAGRTRLLEPMNPADRRIIHTTLADDPAVVTESEGDGYFKRIAVRPA